MIGTGDGLPSDLQAEIGLLSLLIRMPQCVDDCAARIPAECFYRNSNRLIYGAICELAKAGTPIDAVSICDALNARKCLEDAGGIAGVTAIQAYEAQNIPAFSDEERAHFVEVYMQSIKRRFREREGFKALREAALLIREGEDAGSVISAALSKLDVFMHGEGRNPLPLLEMVSDWQEQDKARAERGEVSGVPSGIVPLDKKTRGWQAGNLVILGARPNVGKTALAVNFAMSAARKDFPVVMFSLEMTRDELIGRIIASVAPISMDKINNPRARTADENALVDETATSICQFPLYIDDFDNGQRPTVSAMLAKAKSVKRQNNDKLGLVIVDHLQLVAADGRRENRTQELSAMTAALKQMAKMLSCPVLALSQLSRTVESRNDKRPLLSDLRDSGTIEQDADIVMFLYRGDYYKRGDGGRDNIAELEIKKGRNIRTGTVKLYFDAEYMRFTALEENDSLAVMAGSEWQKGDVPL